MNNRVKNSLPLVLVAALIAVFSIASCGADERSQEQGQQAAQKDGQGEQGHHQQFAAQMVTASSDRDKINVFLSGLGDFPTPDSTQFPTGPPEELPPFTVDDPSAPSGQVKYSCTTTPYSMAENPDKIVTLNPDVGKLWLGSLLQGSGYAKGLGSLKALPIGDRAPLKVYIDLLSPNVTRTVENPDAASMQEAIGSLASDAEQKGVEIPNAGGFQQETAFTKKQGMLSLGFSAKYLGASTRGKLDVSNEAETSTMIAALQQRYFTVSFATPPTPADYFTSDATIGDFEEQADLGRVGVGNPPVVVSSISYGRIFLMTISSQTTQDKLSAAVSAEFSAATAGGKVDLSAEQEEIMKNATVDVVSNGGDEADFRAAVKSHSVDEFLKNPSKLTTARPISYQVDNLSSGSAAAFTETANYNLTTCKAQAGHQETVGTLVKLTNLRVYPERCNQNVYGSVLINGRPIIDIGPDGPFTKASEHVPKALDTAGKWPLFTPPDPDKYHLTDVQFADKGTILPADGLYLAAFSQPPTTAAFDIQAGLSNAIFPFRWDDTRNTYTATEFSPFTLGTKAIQGNSAHCPLDLYYDIEKVSDIEIDVP